MDNPAKPRSTEASRCCWGPTAHPGARVPSGGLALLRVGRDSAGKRKGDARRHTHRGRGRGRKRQLVMVGNSPPAAASKSAQARDRILYTSDSVRAGVPTRELRRDPFGACGNQEGAPSRRTAMGLPQRKWAILFFLLCFLIFRRVLATRRSPPGPCPKGFSRSPLSFLLLFFLALPFRSFPKAPVRPVRVQSVRYRRDGQGARARTRRSGRGSATLHLTYAEPQRADGSSGGT